MISPTPDFEPIEAQRGECYHNAFTFALANQGWDVVHGTPRFRGTGERMGHAWNEITHNGVRWVYDPSAEALLPAGIYYTVGNIEYAKTYANHEALALSVRRGHSGPWDRKIAKAKHNRRKRRAIHNRAE